MNNKHPIPQWKRETIAQFQAYLQADEVVEAVTGGLLHGRAGNYYLLALTNFSLIILEQPDRLGQFLQKIGWNTAQAYSIHRSLLTTAHIEASGTTKKLSIGVCDARIRLEFEQVSVGAEEIEVLLKDNPFDLTQLTTVQLIEQASLLSELGLTSAADLLHTRIGWDNPDFRPERINTRWENQQHAYRVAGIELSILLGISVLLALTYIGGGLEVIGEFVAATVAAVFLIRPLFEAESESNNTFLLRFGMVFIFMSYIAVRYGDWEYFIAVGGITVSIFLLLTGKASEWRTRIAIGLYIVGLAIFGLIFFGFS